MKNIIDIIKLFFKCKHAFKPFYFDDHEKTIFYFCEKCDAAKIVRTETNTKIILEKKEYEKLFKKTKNLLA